MTLTLRTVRVATGYEEEGNLVFDGKERLVAVLVRLSDQNGSRRGTGSWRSGSVLSTAPAIPPLQTSTRRKAG